MPSTGAKRPMLSNSPRKDSALFGSRAAVGGCLPRVASAARRLLPATDKGAVRAQLPSGAAAGLRRRSSSLSNDPAALGYALPTAPRGMASPLGENLRSVEPDDFDGGRGDEEEGEEGEEEDDDDDDEGPADRDAGGRRETAAQKMEAQVADAEPARKAPTVYHRAGVVAFVHQVVSPFPHRTPSIAFIPTDRPYVGDSAAASPTAWVTPQPLDNLHCVSGQRRRIGRKNKFGDLKFQLPERAIRFSAVLGTFTESGFAETQDLSEAWSVRWCKRVEPEEYRALQPFQKVNHFPGTWGIGRKDNLHRRMTALRERFPNEFQFAPEGFLLPQDARALTIDRQQKRHRPPGLAHNVYIVKQVASACGRQMRLLTRGRTPQGKWLVQRYIDNPLLAHGYKFDLRLYVVVTSFNPLRCYVYEEGLVRMASTPYPAWDAEAGKKRHICAKKITAHLTNYCINKKSDTFVSPSDLPAPAAASPADDCDRACEVGHGAAAASGEDEGDARPADDERASKWVLSTVQRYFRARGLDWAGTWCKIEDLIVKTLLAVEGDVAEKLRTAFPTNPAANCCFELFGFDVLITDALQPVLMEVNIMPSLSTQCSLLDQRVKANMIADMLTLVGAYAPAKRHKKCPAKLGHPFLDNNHLSAAEREVILQAEEELHRRMHFKRLFPTATGWTHYQQFFPESIRPLNALLCGWEQAKLIVPPPWANKSSNNSGSSNPSSSHVGSQVMV